MAQTKKKRRSKHRGTAAGTIEARGRTGRKLTEAERSTASKAGPAEARRESRRNRPPSWSSAFYRALAAAALLFVATRLGVGQLSLAGSIVMCVFAVAIYVPGGYAIDSWVYRRGQRAKEAKT